MVTEAFPTVKVPPYWTTTVSTIPPVWSMRFASTLIDGGLVVIPGLAVIRDALASGEITPADAGRILSDVPGLRQRLREAKTEIDQRRGR